MRRILILALSICLSLMGPRTALAYSDAAIINGFNKTVFGSEYARFSFGGPYVRKFRGPVRFYVRSRTGVLRKNQVVGFLRRLEPLISGLKVRIVRSERQANYVVHIVNRSDYVQTVRQDVFANQSAVVRGRCMVRSVFSRNGISRSDAVIVADEGNALFRRCMTEEILQGLGPLNDDRSLRYSMFNDATSYTRFQRFDRLILNVLYDRRVRIGASPAEVAPILPRVVRDVQRRISRG